MCCNEMQVPSNDLIAVNFRSLKNYIIPIARAQAVFAGCKDFRLLLILSFLVHWNPANFYNPATKRPMKTAGSGLRLEQFYRP